MRMIFMPRFAGESMTKPKDKGLEVSEADLKKIAGGAGKKAARKLSEVAVELTDVELRSASGGTRRAAKK